MDPGSAPKTGVITLELLLLWLRLPFGVRNGPPAFQRAMLEAILAHGLEDILGCFIDDVATGGDTHAQSQDHTRRLFAMLVDRHLLAGADKVFLGYTSLRFLGYLLEDGHLKPDPEKVVAIRRLLPPRTRTEARAFLGLTGYYRDFVRGYAGIARPITQLLHEDVAWEWGPAC